MKRLAFLIGIGLCACSHPQRISSPPLPPPVGGAPAPKAIPAPSSLRATATIVDVVNTTIGTITLIDTPAGLLLSGTVTGLGIGPHGIHIHTIGRCQTPDFTSAGPHFNPSGDKHGFKNPDGHHAGDLPNLVSPPAGKYAFELLAPDVKLTGRGGLLDDDGASVVIHSAQDDYFTDPSGNSGGRFACGVITLVR